MTQPEQSPQPDERSAYEWAADRLDSEMIAFYHEAGLIEADEHEMFSRNRVYELVRAAYALGEAHAVEYPQDSHNFFKEYKKEKARRSQKPDI